MAQPDTTPDSASQTLGPALAEFTRNIAQELSTQSPELPSFPDVAVRVREALSNEQIAIDVVVRIVSVEPSLAVRLLQLANSAALNPGSQRVTTLRAAITRIGFNLARSAAIAFAMSQMRRAEAWRGLEVQFRHIWEASARLAAMSYAIARHGGRADADQALLAGMLHSIGRLFVLTRMSRYPALLADAAVRDEIESAWHARAARVLLTKWELPGEVLDAACDFAAPLAEEQHDSQPGSLSDVLAAARYLVSVREPHEIAGAAALAAVPFARLGLDPGAVGEVLSASAEAIAALRAALAD